MDPFKEHQLLRVEKLFHKYLSSLTGSSWCVSLGKVFVSCFFLPPLTSVPHVQLIKLSPWFSLWGGFSNFRVLLSCSNSFSLHTWPLTPFQCLVPALCPSQLQDHLILLAPGVSCSAVTSLFKPRGSFEGLLGFQIQINFLFSVLPLFFHCFSVMLGVSSSWEDHSALMMVSLKQLVCEWL